ncbi:MAG: hypothetical protein U9P50_00495 [Patescibacteria group bacterium]|nr:hypothetical protein [Patescibacteria group bacterium]
MAANTDKFKKGARRFSTTIGTGGVPDETTTTVPLDTTAGLPTATAVQVTIDRVDASGNLTLDKEEVVTGVVSGDNLITCTRGDEGLAQSHAAGAIVEARLTADNWDDVMDGILVEHEQDGTHQADVLSDALSSYLTPIDGWIPSSDTLLYELPNKFTIFNVNRTTTYTKGSKVKLTNDGDVKTFYVVSSSFEAVGGDFETIVTLAGEEDLEVGAITLPYYSYSDCPQGFKKGEDWYKFSAYASAVTAIPTVAFTKVNFATENYDPNGDYDVSTSIFTAPIPGTYSFKNNVELTGMTVGDLILSCINVEGANYFGVRSSSQSANGSSIACLDIRLNAGDVVYGTAYHTNTSSKNTSPDSARTFFSGHFIGV